MKVIWKELKIIFHYGIGTYYASKVDGLSENWPGRRKEEIEEDDPKWGRKWKKHVAEESNTIKGRKPANIDR